MVLRTFIRAEDGATTVDWVVLTAGVTGLGIAVMAVASGGLQDLSTDIETTLNDIEIIEEVTDFVAAQLAANDFAGGALGGWSGGIAGDAGGSLGELLMVGPGGLAELTLDVPDGANQAVFTFDLIGGDSLDNETATVMINGQPVTLATGNHGSISLATPDVPGISVTTNVQSQGQQLGGSQNNGWRESVTSISITVDDPGSSVTLGVSSNANQPINDEFFGIDNVTVDAI